MLKLQKDLSSVYFEVFTLLAAAAEGEAQMAGNKTLPNFSPGRKPSKSCFFLPAERKTLPNFPPGQKAKIFFNDYLTYLT